MSDTPRPDDNPGTAENTGGDANGEPNKPKVLHTRVSENLERELKEKAGALGLSVSTLVRNILSNAFGLVEDIIVDSAKIAHSAGFDGGRERRRRDEPTAAAAAPVTPDPLGSQPVRVLGWHESILNLNAVCQQCNGVLTKGARAAIGVLDGPGRAPIICTECVTEIMDDDNDAQPKA